MAKRIEVSDLDIYYGGFKAVEGVNMTIEPPHGHGADRAVRLRQVDVPAHAQPDARGRARRPGRRARSSSTARTCTADAVDPVAVRRQIGMVFQRPNPFPTMSIYDNVAAGVKLNGGRMRKAAARRAGRALAARREPVGRGQGPARAPGLRPLRRSAAAAVHRPGDRRRAGRAADGRALLRARPDLHARDRGPDRTELKDAVHDRHRDPQHAAGRSGQRPDGVLQHRRYRQAGQADRDGRDAAGSSATRRSRPPRTTSRGGSANRFGSVGAPPYTVRMLADHIEIVGARENNLKDVIVRVPKRQITVFTGVSGSGKSSLVFDTIAAEAQRQLNETFTAFARNFLPRTGSRTSTRSRTCPPRSSSTRSGSAAARGRRSARSPTSTRCCGCCSRGRASRTSATRTRSRSTTRRACAPSARGSARSPRSTWTRSSTGRSRSTRAPSCIRTSRWAAGTCNIYVAVRLVRRRQAARRRITEDEWQQLLYGTGKVPVEWQGGKINATYEGLVDKFTRLYIKKDLGAMAERNREVFERYVTSQACPLCKGARLQPGGARGARSTATTSPSCSRWRRASWSRCCRACRPPVPPRRSLAALIDRVQQPGGHRARLPQPRPGDDDPLRRRVAADQDGAAPEQQPDRHDVHLRRAERRAARPRRAAAQRAAASSCATRATRCWSSSTTAT